MHDDACVRFLQWALPKLRMRWPGFRKVRQQVCKRLQRRVNELGLADIDAYRGYLKAHDDEWPVLDFFCRVTVSRFYRDKVMLEHIRSEVLPELARTADRAGDDILRGWSAGCAMGEEAYTLLLIWYKSVHSDFPNLDLKVTGSDVDDVLLQRARRACYAYSSVKALPELWLKSSFRHDQDEYCLEAHLRNKVEFTRQDIRDKRIDGPFHIIFCRNMAFTYFDDSLQRELLAYLHDSLVEGGALIIGGHEALPEGFDGFEQWQGLGAIYRRL